MFVLKIHTLGINKLEALIPGKESKNTKVGRYTVYGNGVIDRFLFVFLHCMGFFIRGYRPVKVSLNCLPGTALRMTQKNYKKCITQSVLAHALSEGAPMDKRSLMVQIAKILKTKQIISLDKSTSEFITKFDRSKGEAFVKILKNLKEILKKAVPDEEGRIEIPFFIHQSAGDISFKPMTGPLWTEGRLILTDEEISFKTKARLIGFGHCYLNEIKQGLLDHKEDKSLNGWRKGLSKLTKEHICKEFKTHVSPFCLSYDSVPSLMLNDSRITQGHKIHLGTQAYIGIAEPTKGNSSFWKLAFEQDVDVIVKLNQTKNALDATQSETYWPLLDECYSWDNFSVKCTQETQMENSMCKRVFEVKNGTETKQVTQLDYMGWKDMCIPDFHEMMAVLDQADELNKGKKTLMVHCTAGQGRTGTFIAAHHLKHTPEENVSKTVLTLRKQRPVPMVETLSQYYLLHRLQTHFISTKQNPKQSEQ
ncbi:MAG: hypothetical protein CK425_07825 [Parachlamydia sp.]|nr:MAG: hypothetical protein CK425_07825 [Parachlamydia sp.]